MKTILKLCVVLAMGIATACSKSSSDKALSLPLNSGNGFTIFRIAAGQHYASGNDLAAVKTNSIHFLAIIDSSCIYTSKNAENQADINKLYGFSDCGSTHQQNSARFGWNWNGKAMEIHAYCYVNGVRSSTLMGTVQLNAVADYSIKAMDGQYVFTLNGTELKMTRHCSGIIDGYKLYPYFGGDEASPHDMKISIRDLKD